MPYEYYITPEEYAQAAQIGITSRTLERRIRHYGWGKRRAVTTPPRRCMDWSSWVAVAETNGITGKQFHGRLDAGWPPERAATEPIVSYEERSERAAAAKRKVPPALFERAAAHGIKTATLYWRLAQGWEPERAATQPLVSHSERGQRAVQTLKAREGNWAALIFQRRQG